MSCRSFERQAADWLSMRLSPAQSQAMASHRATCQKCAREAAIETQMRGLWRDRPAAPPAADLWPGASARLAEAMPGNRPRLRTRQPRWVPAALLIVLVALSTFCQGTLPRARTRADGRLPERSAAAPSGLTISDLTIRRASPRAAETWPVLSEALQSDPVVDDPVGSNMEDVWTYLNTEHP